MSRPAGASSKRAGRSIEAIVFGFVLLLFTLVIVVSALQLRSSGARFAPLVVGVPTLIAIAWVLVRDAWPRSTRVAPADATPLLPDDVRRLDLELVLAAAHAEEAADDALPTDPEARRRQAIFSAWAVGFVVGALVLGFRLTTPLALFAILVVGTRRLALSVVVTAAASGILWLIFDAFLNVRF